MKTRATTTPDGSPQDPTGPSKMAPDLLVYYDPSPGPSWLDNLKIYSKEEAQQVAEHMLNRYKPGGFIPSSSYHSRGIALDINYAAPLTVKSGDKFSITSTFTIT